MVKLQAECLAGAPSMLSIHSPDYVLMVLITFGGHLSTWCTKSDRVLCFNYSHMRIARGIHTVYVCMHAHMCARTYVCTNICTDKLTPLALCLGTLVQRQNATVTSTASLLLALHELA